MANYQLLKADIDKKVYQNGKQEITGANLNSVLNAMVTTLGAGYQFIGVATPTNPGTAQTPDYKCFYLATTPGTYTNIGGLVVADGEVAILKYDTSWTKEVTGIATAALVDADALLVAQRVDFSGGGWTEMEYAMKSVLSYNIKKTSSFGTIIAVQAIDGNGQQVVVTGFTTLTNVGDNCNIKVARDAAKIKLYFDGGGKVEIKNNILDYVVSAIASINQTDTKQNASIAELDASVFNRRQFSGSTWGAWTAYDFRYNYPYTITNVSDNANSKIIVFEMRVSENGAYRTITYRGDSISNLTPGQTATIIPNGNATEFRAYYDGGLGTIEISGTLDITNSVYDLLDEVQIQEGYSSKDQIKHQVIVAKDGADGHFATIAEAYASITDSSYTNQYEVIVYPGKYNELNLVPPPFTHTHGLAPNSVVVSSEGVDPSSNLPVFDQQVSSTKLSNMTIESHNGYCIHFDEKLSGQVIMNENLRLVKAATPNNTWYVVGGGSFQLGTKYIWKNCVFSSLGDFGQAACHTNGNLVNDNTHLVFDSCSFINCNPRNGSVGGFGNCVVELINCQFPIGVRGLENWYSPIRNIDNPALYRFNKNEWQVIGGGNKNLSMWQSQSGKTIRLVADYPITINGTAASVIFGYNPSVNNVKTARLNCALTSEYYIADEQAGYPPYSEARDVFQLWKRLGDCSTTNKTLTISVNGVSKTYTFTENYLSTKTAQATIIAAMQAVLDNVTIEAITQTGYSYENVNTSDVLMMKVASPDILKGEFVTNTGYKATSATAIKDIVGVACEDKPINEFVKVWTSAFRFDTDYADGEYGLDANGKLDASASTKIGFVKNRIFYLF